MTNWLWYEQSPTLNCQLSQYTDMGMFDKRRGSIRLTESVHRENAKPRRFRHRWISHATNCVSACTPQEREGLQPRRIGIDRPEGKEAR